MSYICPSIRRWLDVTATQRFERRGVWRSFPYRLAVVLPKSELAALAPEAMLDYLEEVTRWVASLRWSQPVSGLDLELSWTPFKKRWSWRTTPAIGQCEVNSGETAFVGGFASGGHRRIQIWRSEDWHKVALHELLHAFGWDRLAESQLKGAGQSGEHQSEALVEAVAVLLHAMVLGGSGDSSGTILADERRWMLAQARALRQRPWTAVDTHVASYYLLKCALLAVPDTYREFLEWLCSSPDEGVCRAKWPGLVARARRRLDAVLARPPSAPQSNVDDGPTMAMNMVRHQLAPTAARAAGRHHVYAPPSATRHGRSFTNNVSDDKGRYRCQWGEGWKRAGGSDMRRMLPSQP